VFVLLVLLLVITLTLAFGLYLRFKISRYQHCFSKPKSAITNLITLIDLIDFISSLVDSQRQANAIYYNRINALDLVPHSFLLPSSLSSRKSQVLVSGIVSSPSEFLSGVPQGSVM
jgi:hypothetical protein